MAMETNAVNEDSIQRADSMMCREQLTTTNFLMFDQSNKIKPQEDNQGIFGDNRYLLMDDDQRSCGCYLNSRNNSLWPTTSNFAPMNKSKPDRIN